MNYMFTPVDVVGQTRDHMSIVWRNLIWFLHVHSNVGCQSVAWVRPDHHVCCLDETWPDRCITPVDLTIMSVAWMRPDRTAASPQLLWRQITTLCRHCSTTCIHLDMMRRQKFLYPCATHLTYFKCPSIPIRLVWPWDLVHLPVCRILHHNHSWLTKRRPPPHNQYRCKLGPSGLHLGLSSLFNRWSSTLI
jgi:hypothetical protein